MINIAYAATQYNPQTGVIGKINEVIIEPIIGFLIALAVVYFLWGVIEFIAGSDNEEKRDAGKKHMMWGVAGIFIMVSVFGIMNLICGTLNC